MLPRSNWDVLASLLWRCHAVHLHMQSMVHAEFWFYYRSGGICIDVCLKPQYNWGECNFVCDAESIEKIQKLNGNIPYQKHCPLGWTIHRPHCQFSLELLYANVRVPPKNMNVPSVPWRAWNSILTVICDLYFNRQDVTEDDLRLLFSNAGGTVKAFKFFQYVDLSHSKISHIYPLNRTWQPCQIQYRLHLGTVCDSCFSLSHTTAKFSPRGA